MSKVYRAVQFGCGPIGCGVVRYCLDRPTIKLVGAVDVDPGKSGRDLGEVAGLDRKLDLRVTADAAKLLAKEKPDIVFHTTGSKLPKVAGQLETILSAGVNIVSTCEELSYPFHRYPELASRLDALAKKKKASLLATGINPGFLMDVWPLFMTGVCKDVQTITVRRIQDATSRRIPFQQKIGAGLTPEEFRRKVETGEFGHVGLPESISMIAAGLGWGIEKIEETIDPVVLDHSVASSYISVEAGKAAGIRQEARGLREGKAVIVMDFKAYLGAPESFDAVEITGTPNLNVRIQGGTQGDIGTISIVVNAVPRVVEAPPGLLTMMNLPPVICAAAHRP